jgi:hypothetical protein
MRMVVGYYLRDGKRNHKGAILTLRRCAAATLLILVWIVPTALASHKPTDYCSPSGDICLSTKKVDGVRKLRFSEVQRYYSSFTLCVKAPDGTRECHDFDVRRSDSSFGKSVVWRDHYDARGPGAYTVVWKSDGSVIGRKMGFHIH